MAKIWPLRATIYVTLTATQILLTKYLTLNGSCFTKMIMAHRDPFSIIFVNYSYKFKQLTLPECTIFKVMINFIHKRLDFYLIKFA